MSPGPKWARARSLRWFVRLNGLSIASFALGGLLLPGPFWSALGVPGQDGPLTRVMAWYLLVFGLCGLAVAKRPERHPWVVLAMGIEKLGPAVAFPWLFWSADGSILLLLVGLADAVLSVILIGYGRILLSTHYRIE